MTLSPGYETKHVMSLDLIFPPGLGYNHAKQLAEVNQLLGRIGNVPGVKSVTDGPSSRWRRAPDCSRRPEWTQTVDR